MKTVATLALLIFLSASACDQEVTFCVQYVNTTDIRVAFQAVDNKNVLLEASVSLPPPSETNNIPFASNVFTVTGFVPITFSAPNQLETNCIVSPGAGRIYRVEAVPSGLFECVDEGTCDNIAARMQSPWWSWWLPE